MDSFSTEKPLINKASFHARKTLSLHAWRKNPETLKLPKHTINTILKKHCSKKIPEGLLKRKQMLLYGLCSGNNINIQGGKRAFAPSTISDANLTRYQKILMNSRTISRVSMEGHLNLPNPLHTFQAMQNLQSLQISLTAPQLLLFSRSLKRHFKLKELSITLKPKNADKWIGPPEAPEDSISKFFGGLQNQKSLKKLSMNLWDHLLFRTVETANVLFSCLGDLNLSHFDIIISMPRNNDFQADKGSKFFATIEFLKADSSIYTLAHMKGIQYRKNLILIGRRNALGERNSFGENFEAILVKCSSLKSLDFDLEASSNKVPWSPGLAKNVINLKLTIRNLKNPMQTERPLRLKQLLSEFGNLSNLEVVTDQHELLVAVQSGLGQSLSLKSYSLYFNDGTDFLPIQQSCANLLFSLEQLCKQLSNIQTIKKLSFKLHEIRNVSVVTPILEHCPGVKQLELEVYFDRSAAKTQLKQSVHFPIESLVYLEAIEVLTIKIQALDKEDFLKRLPKLSPSLQHLEILGDSCRIDLQDYKEKFALS